MADTVSNSFMEEGKMKNTDNAEKVINEINEILKKYRKFIPGLVFMIGIADQELDPIVNKEVNVSEAIITLGNQEYINELINHSLFKNKELLAAVTQSVVVIDRGPRKNREPEKEVN